MRKRTQPQDEAFQMAPMIDMVFLLLVFFMTVSTLAKESRPEVDLPVSQTAEVPEEAPPREILTLIPDGEKFRLYLFNREVQLDELPTLLGSADKRDPGAEFLLRGTPNLPWKAWEKLFGILRRAGVRNIIFSTFES